MSQPVKQPINIDFSQGLNLKADPYQVPVGNFLSLVNTVFDKVGRLTKRNGFGSLPTLPDTSTAFLTTFNGDLQAVGNNLLALNASQPRWISKGSTYPIELSTLPLIRSSVQQSQADSTIAPNGLICTAYTESNGVTTVHKYAIADSVTGQNVVAPIAIASADATYGTPRVFLVSNYFVIVYTAHPSAYTLNYVAIAWASPEVTPMTGVLSASYAPATTVAWDGAVLNNTLYLSYSLSSSVRLVSLSGTLVASSSVAVDGSHSGTVFSVVADVANSKIWITYWNVSAGGFTASFLPGLIAGLAPTATIPSGTTVTNITSLANGTLNYYWEVVNSNYNYIKANTCTATGTVGTAFISVRSVGLASKAFSIGGSTYFLSAHSSTYQPSYFLIDASTSTSAAPVVVAKLAYSNGGGYLSTGLPSVFVSGTSAQMPYLLVDLLETQAPSGTQSISLTASPVYTQTGVQLATFTFTATSAAAVEIGHNLNLTGGLLWAYDGYQVTEQNFFLWPEPVTAVWSTSGGSIHAQPDGTTNTNAYYYQVCYEWTDNQGNLFRSSPSIPTAVTTTGTSTAGSITLTLPTLRLTYKVATPVSIVVYRWSVAQPEYHQVTSITTPLQNDPTVDTVTLVDTFADATITPNNIIYTTGGVVEDISPPATNILALFDDRLWLVDAEDPNLLWFSKQVIEGTPVEMSDLFTFFVAPTTGAQGSTGDITALFPMDDKLVIFKETAIYYVNGAGPDNTGTNNGYSQPIFVSSTVGCANPKSIVLMPKGLMFQSDKGIWLLGRDLSTTYIGAAVEDFNAFTVTSSVAVPDTNQVRFSLSNGTTLLYDYFVGQWGQFEGISPVASTLYQNLHTTADIYGNVNQETPGIYLDGANPVLMSFTTSWLQLAGLRGYQRAYWFYFLGTYLSPHKLQIQIAYDYNNSPIQSDLFQPSQSPMPYNSDPFYGGDGTAPYGGVSNIEQARVFLQRQRCKAFQLSIQEVFDPTYGTVAGPGLTLSGLNCTVGVKKSYSPIQSKEQIG
jgi:hypothetical protein